ncbi:hypothetical protein DES53_11624 [Roseimicrobium gellanilyticum]|uniref:Uncharacterized protein n=1 Tax=Roseimicrobium gellanilyticum TaxID=748857 RepID=A0A366H3Y3_9BACT|nr:hypothetical protein DES53_11624 [Roseimicrobium gellanilyticum]
MGDPQDDSGSPQRGKGAKDAEDWKVGGLREVVRLDAEEAETRR